MPIAAPSPHEREVGDNRVLQDELLLALPRLEDLGLLGRGRVRHRSVRPVTPRQAPLGDLGPHSGCREEGRNAGAAGAHPLGERSPAGTAPPRALRPGTAGRTPCSPRRSLATIRRSRPAPSRTPSPKSSTPALLETASMSPIPACRIASINTDGIPHSPNHPPRSSRRWGRPRLPRRQNPQACRWAKEDAATPTTVNG